MMCEHCGQRPASVHIVKQVNNHREERHLCDQCARDQGQEAMEGAFGFPNFSLQQLLSSLLESDTWGVTAPSPRQQGAEPHCPSCGLTFSRFKQHGFLGCGRCYEVFEAELVPLLRRVQGSDQHQGKAPKRAGGVLRLRKELAQLKSELQRAVTREEFEKAAQLRDRIKELEQRVKAGGEASAVE